MVQDWQGAATGPGLACMDLGDEDLQPVRCKVERDGKWCAISDLWCSLASSRASTAFLPPPRVGHLGGGDEDPALRSSRSKCRRAEAGGPEFWPARDGHLPSRWPARRQADGCASRGRLEHRTKGEQLRKGGRDELWHASPEQKFVRYTLSRRAINRHLKNLGGRK